MFASNITPKKTQYLTLAISITYCKYNLCLIFYVFHVMRLSVYLHENLRRGDAILHSWSDPYYTPYIPYYV